MSLDPARLDDLTDKLVSQMKSVYDPEIPVDIYELGLIYKIDVEEDELDPEKVRVEIDMTLTAPGCPVAGQMPQWVEDAALKVDDVAAVKVNMTFDPPWDPSRMSDEAKLELNMM